MNHDKQANDITANYSLIPNRKEEKCGMGMARDGTEHSVALPDPAVPTKYFNFNETYWGGGGC